MKKVLSVVLALAMVFSMSIMVSAATTAEGTATVAEVDGKLVVTVAAKGDLAQYDFGVGYDADKVTYESVNLTSDFMMAYVGGGGITANDNIADKNYVVIGGTTKAAFDWDGDIATVTFALKDGVNAEDVEFAVAPDSAALNDAGVAIKDATGAAIVKYEPAVVDPTDEPTDVPVDPTDEPTVDEPVVDPTVAPTTAPTTAPKTADTASVVVPVVAIVAAAAAVVVVSKKRVEE